MGLRRGGPARGPGCGATRSCVRLVRIETGGLGCIEFSSENQEIAQLVWHSLKRHACQRKSSPSARDSKRVKVERRKYSFLGSVDPGVPAPETDVGPRTDFACAGPKKGRFPSTTLTRRCSTIVFRRKSAVQLFRPYQASVFPACAKTSELLTPSLSSSLKQTSVCDVAHFAESGDRMRSQSGQRPDRSTCHNEFTHSIISRLLCPAPYAATLIR
jgi:hypothetical protein